jgi:glycosyltransferase involved in cell wall biosynthesis
MIRLTVFTPTYNRAHTLLRGYEALLRQSCKDFIWLIIDDGSTDNTREMVVDWTARDNGFEIRYAYKENGGLHTGYNKAIELTDTELCVCIDSDDYMPDDAVEIILDFWGKHGSQDIAGFIGLDYDMEGRPLGGLLPEVETLHVVELYDKYRHKADTKIVMRTDLLKRVAPQPTFKGEKNFNPTYMIMQINAFAPFKVLNRNLCYVDYQPDGMTAGNVYRQYLNNPNSYAAMRVETLRSRRISARYRLIQYLHLTVEAVLAKDLQWLHRTPCPAVAYLLLPMGWGISKVVRYKAKK